jgi:hypothetical protein
MLQLVMMSARISYKNDSSNEPHILTVPGCSQLCPLDRFKGTVGFVSQFFDANYCCNAVTFFWRHRSREGELLDTASWCCGLRLHNNFVAPFQTLPLIKY